MGEALAKARIAGGIRNCGTMMPPTAPIRILPTPPMTVACSEVRTRLAINSAQHTAAKLTAQAISHNASKAAGLVGSVKLAPPNAGTR